MPAAAPVPVTQYYYYCNGFDGNEIPLAVGSDGNGNYYLAGQEEPTSTYGIKYVNGQVGYNRAPLTLGLNDRNVSVRMA